MFAKSERKCHASNKVKSPKIDSRIWRQWKKHKTYRLSRVTNKMMNPRKENNKSRSTSGDGSTIYNHHSPLSSAVSMPYQMNLSVTVAQRTLLHLVLICSNHLSTSTSVRTWKESHLCMKVSHMSTIWELTATLQLWPICQKIIGLDLCTSGMKYPWTWCSIWATSGSMS